MPVEIDEVERRIRQLEIESRARQGSRPGVEGPPRAPRGRACQPRGSAELDDRSLAAGEGEDRSHPRAEGARIEARAEAERARSANADLQRAAELRYGALVELDGQLEAEGAALTRLSATGSS